MKTGIRNENQRVSTPKLIRPPLNSSFQISTVLAALAMLSCTALAVADDTMFGWKPLLDRTLRSAERLKITPDEMAHILVETGDGTQADLYYKRISTRISFDIANSHLDNLLEYLGYKGLRAVDLETLDPSVLSPQDQQGFTLLTNSVESAADFKANPDLTLATFKADALLSARFFAPKIVDFNAKPDTANGHDPHTAGWRKLVRLNATPKSAAATKGNIASAYILFNFFSENPKVNPFPVKAGDGKSLTNQSVNNQVILVPRSFKKGVEDSAFFLDYQPFSVDRYKVGNALKAAFDTLDPNDSKQDYFVPTACSQCHGHDTERGAPNDKGFYSFAKVNYLDTDQWYDMMNFDFPNNKAQHDVVFDGGDSSHSSAKYKSAVRVFAKLNAEILRQNETALRSDGSDGFKILAVKKWISLHGNGEGPVDPLKRSIGKASWTNNDLPLLEMLDRYCFRCHSSMYYDVFDRAAVLKEKGTATKPGPLLSYVSSGFMPQGRKLDKPELDKLVNFLKALK